MKFVNMASRSKWFCIMKWKDRSLILFYLSALFMYSVADVEISDKKLCADRECRGTISEAVALGDYYGELSDPLLLSFKRKDVIVVKSKSAGSNKNLWGGEINGKYGFFPKNFVREENVIVSSPQYVVDSGYFPPKSVEESENEESKNEQNEKGEDAETKDEAVVDANKEEKTESNDSEIDDETDESSNDETGELLDNAGDETEIDDNEVDTELNDDDDDDLEDNTAKDLNSFLKDKLSPGSNQEAANSEDDKTVPVDSDSSSEEGSLKKKNKDVLTFRTENDPETKTEELKGHGDSTEDGEGIEIGRESYTLKEEVPSREWNRKDVGIKEQKVKRVTFSDDDDEDQDDEMGVMDPNTGEFVYTHVKEEKEKDNVKAEEESKNEDVVKDEVNKKDDIKDKENKKEDIKKEKKEDIKDKKEEEGNKKEDIKDEENKNKEENKNEGNVTVENNKKEDVEDENNKKEIAKDEEKEKEENVKDEEKEKEENVKDKENKREDVKDEENEKEEVKDENKKEDSKDEEIKKDYVKDEENKKEEVKDENKKEDSKDEESKKDYVKDEENKKEDVKGEENKKEEVKDEENKKEDSKDEESKKEDVKDEVSKKEDVKDEENKKEDVKDEESKKEDVQDEESKKEGNVKDEKNKKEDLKYEENKKEDSKDEENKKQDVKDGKKEDKKDEENIKENVNDEGKTKQDMKDEDQEIKPTENISIVKFDVEEKKLSIEKNHDADKESEEEEMKTEKEKQDKTETLNYNSEKSLASNNDNKDHGKDAKDTETSVEAFDLPNTIETKKEDSVETQQTLTTNQNEHDKTLPENTDKVELDHRLKDDTNTDKPKSTETVKNLIEKTAHAGNEETYISDKAISSEDILTKTKDEEPEADTLSANSSDAPKNDERYTASDESSLPDSKRNNVESEKKDESSNTDVLFSSSSGNQSIKETLSENNVKSDSPEKSEFSDPTSYSDDSNKQTELESSITEPVSSLSSSETPSLDDIKTSQDVPPSSDASFTTTANSLSLTAEKSNSNDLLNQETIYESGTTIILDQTGGIITAIYPEQDSTSSESVATSSLAETESLENTQAISVVEKSIQPSETLNLTEAETNTLKPNNSKTNSTTGKTQLADSPADSLKDHGSQLYQSIEFNSRKVLSVNQNQPTLNEPQKPQEDLSVKSTPKEEISPTSKSDEAIESSKIGSLHGFLKGEVHAGRSMGDLLEDDETKEEEEEVVYGKSTHSDSDITTQPTPDDIPPPPIDASTDLYDTEKVLSRKIADEEELLKKEEEEYTKAHPGFVKSVMKNVDRIIKSFIEKLPPSLQSLLEQEPLGLSPTTAVLATILTVVVLTVFTFSAVCGSDDSKKKLKTSVAVIQELEAKLQLAVKEKENLEDLIDENKAENSKLKANIEKHTKGSKDNLNELETVKLHNSTLKKQVKKLQEELEDTKNNANTSQGEVKQHSKKTKELEKSIKKLEESEKKLLQENEKLSFDLRHQVEEVASVTSKIDGLSEQIGHLETRKEQLLAEGEDWKEKVNDLKERLEQREEEFKEIQESASLRENELEILKDCFIQLKSFEESDEDASELSETTQKKIQEKLQAMMDVSKTNASLRSVEEEKNALENKLRIESEARLELEEQLEKSRKSVESSMTDKMKSERQCQEAQTKLNVLSSYFKEKEMQLQRELGEQEALKKQNLNKLESADEVSKTMQQEVEVVRTQNESLKRELASSERDFRAQIAANEKKAHENWLAARSAERELKEARHDASVLRQKLTDLERRQFMGPGGLIRPLPTRGMPPPGMMNGPPPPHGMDRPPSLGSMPPPPPSHLRDDEYRSSPLSPRGEAGGVPPPHLDRRGPPRGPGSDGRSPPPRMPPFNDGRSPPPRLPPPGMIDGRSPPPFDRRPPPHMMDNPPYRPPHPDMIPPHLRGSRLPPPHLSRGGSRSPLGTDSSRSDSRQDSRYPGAGYNRNQSHGQSGSIDGIAGSSPNQQSQV